MLIDEYVMSVSNVNNVPVAHRCTASNARNKPHLAVTEFRTFSTTNKTVRALRRIAEVPKKRVPDT